MSGQTSYKYLLSTSFEEVNKNFTDLEPLPNSDGETGFFNSFNVPVTTCPNSFDVDGYNFADNAGLRFDNNGFIDCEYTIQFTFHIESFNGSQNWVRLLNFTPSDDNGIYIKITDRPDGGTLDFWPNGLVGADNFFNTTDLYQFIVTRNCAGGVNIYVNGTFFANYDDSNNPLYLIQPDEDLIDFFRDDTAVPNEASAGWVKNIIISDFEFDDARVEMEWSTFCEVLEDTDCAGVVNGNSILDSCGVCLEPADPNFNQSCVDCAGEVNGTAVLDSCGVCLDPADPEFNASCADCAGTPNGNAIFDSCGVCLEPNDANFNTSCADCLGIPNGNAILDSCGVCMTPGDPLFNQSCLDCAGIPNGTSVIDECGECLEPNNPEFNQSCITTFYFPTSFSPNQDGYNDVFEIGKSDETAASIQLYQIYNRWGGLVYEARNFDFSDYSRYWSGYYKNNTVDSGVYIYNVEIVFENGTVKQYTGDVTVIK